MLHCTGEHVDTCSAALQRFGGGSWAPRVSQHLTSCVLFK